jgi:hypothetical protein
MYSILKKKIAAILRANKLEERIAALESQERLTIHQNPAQQWLDSLPIVAECVHCHEQKQKYAHDGYGRIVCSDCKPEHWLWAAQRGVAKGI